MSYCWKNVLINKNKNIRKALEVIDKEALRIALVIDDSQKLLGVVTDGDIRRGLLRGITLDDSISTVMNSTPLVARENVSSDQLLKKMEDNDILSIPIVDEFSKVIGLKSIRDSITQPTYDNPVFIMAGGFGTRLKPLTDNCPKPMLVVGDKPILETLVLGFKKAGFKNIYISTHYLPNIIEEHFGNGERLGVNIQYIHETTPLGTGGALGLLPKEQINLPIILINGDVLTSVSFNKVLSFHNQQDAVATMCVREYEYQVPYGVIEGENNEIKKISEKPIHRFFVNAGIYVLSPSVIKNVSKNTKIDMTVLLENYILAGKKVSMFPVHEYWLDIGQIEDFKKAQSDYFFKGFQY